MTGFAYALRLQCSTLFRSVTNASRDHSHASETFNKLPVTAIVAFAKGFACAAGAGLVHLYEKSEEDYYKKIREIQVTLISPALHYIVLHNTSLNTIMFYVIRI